MEGYGMFEGRASELIPGKKYKATSFDDKQVTFIEIDRLYADGNAVITVSYKGRLYTASSLQLYT